MALPPRIYERARRKAQLHVQIRLAPIHQKVDEMHEKFPITGEIVRIFRGKRICRIGQIVEFDVAILESWDFCLISGILWLQYSELLSNPYMEVYLNGKPPKCDVALYQYKLIKTPTEQATLLSAPAPWWEELPDLLQRFSYKIRYWLRWQIWLP